VAFPEKQPESSMNTAYPYLTTYSASVQTQLIKLRFKFRSNVEVPRMNKQKVFVITAAVSMLSITSPLQADNVVYGTATVLSVEPITRTVRVSRPIEECWDQEVVYRESTGHDYGVSTVVGAVLGGALGNAVGHSNTNKKVGAVVGAVLGGTLGRAHGARKHHGTHEYTRIEERCEVINDYEEQERTVGYRVEYKYGNAVYTTRTDQPPGDTIKVRVTIAPV
jgi:uncharacterized protein YcfJ